MTGGLFFLKQHARLLEIMKYEQTPAVAPPIRPERIITSLEKYAGDKRLFAARIVVIYPIAKPAVMLTINRMTTMIHAR